MTVYTGRVRLLIMILFAQRLSISSLWSSLASSHCPYYTVPAPSNCDAQGYEADMCSTLAPTEIGDSLSVSLYTVPEIGRTVQELSRTVTSAIKHNKSKVVPYICLGCGYRRDVLYPYGGSAIYSNAWGYDESYSYLLGAYVNTPQFGKEPLRYGHWEYVKSVIFPPSIVDTEGDLCRGVRDAQHRNSASPCVASSPANTRAIRLKHFAAYVRGAATTRGVISNP
jgi:hypothetical protein